MKLKETIEYMYNGWYIRRYEPYSSEGHQLTLNNNEGNVLALHYKVFQALLSRNLLTIQSNVETFMPDAQITLYSLAKSRL